MKTLFTILFLTVFTASCTFVEKQNGAKIEQADLDQVKIGKSTRLDVYNLLGAPSTVSNLGGETWYYVYTEANNAFFVSPTNNRQDTLSIKFGEGEEAEFVSKMNVYNAKSGKKISFDSDKTVTSGRKVNFIDQMLGNFGKFGTQLEN